MSKLLVRHATVITMVERRILRDGYILIEDGLVTSVGAGCEVPPGSSDDRVLDADGSVVIPGLIDAHAHVQEYVLRDLIDESMDPGDVLSRFVDPVYERMTPDLEADVARYFLSESLRCGVTTVATAALDPAAVLRAAEEVGIRLAVGPIVDTPGRTLDATMSFLSDAARARPGWVTPLVAPRRLDVDPGLLAEHMARWNARLFAHLRGISGELSTLARSGVDLSRSILAYDPRTPEDELVEAVSRGVGLVVCPTTLMRLGLGLGRSSLHGLYMMGAKMATGSGGFAGVAALDPLRNAGLMALVLMDTGKGRREAGWWALSSVTSAAADVIGSSSLGRIAPGARGDLVVLDPRTHGGRPVGGDPHVYAVHRGGCQDVRTIVVDGNVIWSAESPVQT
ncbi:amidohydrolase family protein [Conexivisphaera calida]|uniref:Amidohydrolase n=1 Tax=Conexivisphaera calida TaxID=1874277 RepID=A0A4P2VBE0_9ARCH|nr:amidohydrolase family protein [Conexivisphaera calida]BBE41856.1 amidohydrolase [Conexivisphaera calida]